MRSGAYLEQGGLAAAAIDCGGRGFTRLVRMGRALWSDRAGATAIEYGIITVLIAVGAMTVAQSLG
ncbi:Flp family type IVb pilin, partial [Klebsiella pneumoniae]|uniref:Flp family type IVb pilin n=1 Tax=Klebsiella pneumoniae TaxID=573 RepID=UPI00300A0B2D